MDTGVDEKKLLQVKKHIAQCILESIEKGFLTLEDAHEAVEYVGDVLEFIHTDEDIEELYEELLLDWNIDTTRLLQKQELQRKENDAQKVDTKEIESIKNKLSMLATT